MSELEIPERALRVACDVYDAALTCGIDDDDKSGGECAEKQAIRAAAPIIVAAAYRKRAEEVEVRASDASYDQPEQVTEALLNEARLLRLDADELDPEGADSNG